MFPPHTLEASQTAWRNMVDGHLPFGGTLALKTIKQSPRPEAQRKEIKRAKIEGPGQAGSHVCLRRHSHLQPPINQSAFASGSFDFHFERRAILARQGRERRHLYFHSSYSLPTVYSGGILLRDVTVGTLS